LVIVVVVVNFFVRQRGIFREKGLRVVVAEIGGGTGDVVHNWSFGMICYSNR